MHSRSRMGRIVTGLGFFHWRRPRNEDCTAPVEVQNSYTRSWNCCCLTPASGFLSTKTLAHFQDWNRWKGVVTRITRQGFSPDSRHERALLIRGRSTEGDGLRRYQNGVIAYCAVMRGGPKCHHPGTRENPAFGNPLYLNVIFRMPTAYPGDTDRWQVFPASASRHLAVEWHGSAGQARICI